MTGESNQDADLDEAFAALVAETDDVLVPERDDLLAAPSARSSITSSVSVDEAALRSMLPARGLTQPGWDATSPQPPRAAVAHALQTPSDGTVTASPSTHGAAIFCPTCKGSVDVRSRHVAVHGGAVRVYCSAACLDKRDELPPEATPVAIAPPAKRRRAWWLVAFAVPAAAAAAYVTLHEPPPPAQVPPPPALAVQAPAEPPALVVDPEREADARLVEELSRDAWIHPLAGPARRMPRNHSGAFGASRPGERPPECVSGHCGVDLGYVWGEPVYAVHEGVIEFVNRGPNEDRGGAFVRIEHRDGTLFSWYFHLAAIPRNIRRGVKVKAGDLIGLVGDTGIKHSKPHLHFSLSVKTSKHGSERYLDPEPLIAIWPLWIPNADHEGGIVSTAPEPGVPVRAAGKRRPKRAKSAKAAKAAKAAREKETAAVEPAEPSAGSDTTAPSSSTSAESFGASN